MYYNELRDELIDYYNDINKYKFLKKNYSNYRNILLNLSNTNIECKEGALRYFSNKDVLELYKSYLNKYFKDYLNDFNKTTIEIYNINNLINYIKASDEEKHDKKYNYLHLTKEEAEDLLISSGMTDFIFNDIKVVTHKSIVTSLSICHEYTHKIHNLKSKHKYTDDWYIFTEYLAYYNTYLFGEYLESLGYLSDISIAFNYDLIITIRQIKLFKLMDDLYYGNAISSIDLKIIDNSLEIGNIPLYDYPHLISFISAKTKYEETKNLSLSIRTKELEQLLRAKVNSKLLRENNLDISDKNTVKKLIMNFTK